MRDGKMHQTTVRFGPDLWEALETECGRLGVSAAQYLREAALARLAYTAGRVGSRRYEMALTGAGAEPIRGVGAGFIETAPPREPDPPSEGDERAAVVAAVKAEATDQTSSSSALQAQSKLTVARTRLLRQQAARLRGARFEGRHT